MNKWVDLTVDINQEYLPYPGDTGLKFNWSKTYNSDGYNLSELQLNMHLGTHIDYKKHCLNETDTPNFERFIGKANVLKITTKNKLIKTKDIKEAYDHLENKHSIIIFDFNHTRFLNSTEYYQVPVFETDVLDFFKDNHIKLIGSDLPSYEYHSGHQLKMHQDLFEADIYLIENLTNLDKLSHNVYIIALPLKISTLEASMVRAIAKNIAKNI